MKKGEPLNLDIKLKANLTYKWGNEYDFINFKKGYEKGFSEAQNVILKMVKQRIKSACEFYLEWRNDPKLFINWYEDKKKVDELLRFLEHYFGDEWYDDYDNEPCVKEKIVLKYNEWLFKLVFKDVLGGGD